MTARVTIIGAGLAGCEAALTLAAHGVEVELIEQKPAHRTPAQVSEQLCELVCSNSFRGAALTNAVGLLKEEMRRTGSFVMRAADATRVPAGGALAVDRERFAAQMTSWVRGNPRIRIRVERVERVPDVRPLVIATGPLTGDALAADIARRVGEDALAYYDAIAPIVSADSIDWSKVFVASRWDKGESEAEKAAYVNCPLDEAQYRAFVEAVRAARKVEPKPFEEPRYFEGCLPIEVMAERGEMTLAFGPMKPVGLVDPRTGRRPFAVVQLRKEDEAGTAYNLVGFQSRMARPEQERIFRTIPGLEAAEFLRYGAVHRNTFLNAPRLLDGTFQLRSDPGLYFAGQVAGTEGYVESAAGGLLVALILLDRLRGRSPLLPPPTTALGGILTHVSRNPETYQPSNITFAHLSPWTGPRLSKTARYEAMAERALRDLDAWLATRSDAGAAALALGSIGSAPVSLGG
ncbi:MAG: methylenetetrahydrofolate--tRNA-(uracil(54)-C(5))-methyltransferase (FADH(2)-oxidizing) TrmFO [Pseudomonadota bacterium]|nr:MAG: methylenetetrahydrofolate--tRNA-(uracil(54)-C(5))-methyltransferase (FADH(2)-oxidizing) TrmFO [Pseudomonadota bacterium]